MKPPLNHMMLNEDPLADEFDAILGYRTSHEGLVLGGEDDPADFPALMAWWKGNDGAGTTLEDWLYAMTAGARGVGGAAIMTINAAGAGNAWGTPGAFSTSLTASNEVDAKSLIVAPRAAGQIGYPDVSCVLIEVDAAITPPAAASGQAFAVGRATSTTNQGLTVSRNATGNILVRVCGATNAPAALNWNETAVQNATGRNHWLAVYDQATATVSLYLNGQLVSSRIFASAPGAVRVPNSNTDGRIGFGVSVAATPAERLTQSVYNARVWHVASVPADIAVIASQMAANPDRLPVGMAEVS